MKPNKINFLFFDCMETLIDMVHIPDDRDYALWAFEGSGAEKYWDSPQEFVEHFLYMRKLLRERPPSNKEYSMRERCQIVAEKKLGIKDKKNNRKIAEHLSANFWSKYQKECYVSRSVYEALESLAEKGYNMGVVSNFLIPRGVEDLLEAHNLAKFFQFTLTSVDEGWRKPHPQIYRKGLSKGKVAAAEVLFIGDDYQNDYLSPQALGFQTILYDRQNIYPQADRFENFEQLKYLL